MRSSPKGPTSVIGLAISTARSHLLVADSTSLQLFSLRRELAFVPTAERVAHLSYDPGTDAYVVLYASGMVEMLHASLACTLRWQAHDVSAEVCASLGPSGPGGLVVTGGRGLPGSLGAELKLWMTRAGSAESGPWSAPLLSSTNQR